MTKNSKICSEYCIGSLLLSALYLREAAIGSKLGPAIGIGAILISLAIPGRSSDLSENNTESQVILFSETRFTEEPNCTSLPPLAHNILTDTGCGGLLGYNCTPNYTIVLD